MPAALEFEKPIQELQAKIEELKNFSIEKGIDLTSEISILENRVREVRQSIYGNLTSWQKVLIARHPERPNASFYIARLFTDFIELHGDRCFRDDPSVVGGIGRFNGQAVTVICHLKGKDTKENIARNFGMAHPEGYRKAIRLMKQAEKFKRPVITIIDTPGAYPGMGAEERGQSEAIAKSIFTMAALRVPIVSVVIGEGGSGGALAFGVGNRVLMQEHAVYSVITPEGYASILWRDSSRNREAADAMKVTAQDLLAFGVIDQIVPEPLGGAHQDPETAVDLLGKTLTANLDELLGMDEDILVANRYEKFRAMGNLEKLMK
jgi:acetyl-CoA carboxylase carboxyl transferase subunit alpha